MLTLTLLPVFRQETLNDPSRKDLQDLHLMMWRAAAKAGDSIPNGYRLENLSWRLWYKTSRHREYARTNENSYQATNETCIKGDQMTGSQATNPIDLPIKRLSDALTNILTEIQLAAQQDAAAKRPFPPPPLLTAAINKRPMDEFPLEERREEKRPSPKAKTINQQHHHPKERRRKKDVDKFIRKFQPQLESITEATPKESHVETTAMTAEASPSSQTHVVHGFDINSTRSSTSSLSQAGSSGSNSNYRHQLSFSSTEALLDDPPEEGFSYSSSGSANHPIISASNARSHSISPRSSGDRRPISLLTILLSQRSTTTNSSGESATSPSILRDKRPDSCPPPHGMEPPLLPSPPSRPDGPVSILSPRLSEETSVVINSSGPGDDHSRNHAHSHTAFHHPTIIDPSARMINRRHIPSTGSGGNNPRSSTATDLNTTPLYIW